LLQGFAEGSGELGDAIVIEQAEELRGEPGGGFAVLESGLQERLTFRNQSGLTTGSRCTQGLAFLFEQGLAMREVFDLLVAVVGAAMGSDFGPPVEQANGGGRSHQGQSAAQGLRRHGIIVEVKADAEGFIGVDGPRRVTGKRVSGERQQVRFLFFKNLRHGAGVIPGQGR